MVYLHADERVSLIYSARHQKRKNKEKTLKKQKPCTGSLKEMVHVIVRECRGETTRGRTCVCFVLSAESSQSSSQCNGSAELSSPISQTSPMTLSSPSASPAGSGVLSPTPSGTASLQTTFSKPASVVSKIHSRRFREYVFVAWCTSVILNHELAYKFVIHIVFDYHYQHC